MPPEIPLIRVMVNQEEEEEEEESAGSSACQLKSEVLIILKSQHRHMTSADNSDVIHNVHIEKVFLQKHRF